MSTVAGAQSLPSPGLVVLTGAGGLLGRAVLRELSASGAPLRILVGPPGTSTADVLGDVDTRHGFVEDEETVRALVDGAAVVVHLAGPASVAASYRRPVEFARSHVVGTAALMQGVAAAGSRRVVLVSSAEVYGRPQERRVSEDHPTRPESPYAAVKLAGEGVARAMARAHDTELVVLRPFSVYGAESPPSSLVGLLLRQVLSGDALEVADLRPVRDYVHVHDVARAVRAACSAPVGDDAVTCNVASGVGWSVGAVAQEVLSAAGRTLPVRSVRARDRPLSAVRLELVGETTTARDALGWAAEVDLPAGLRQALSALAQHDHG